MFQKGKHRSWLLMTISSLVWTGAAAQGMNTTKATALTQQRQRAYATFRAQFDQLRVGCGRTFSEGRTRLVFFPVGQSQFFYTQDFGLHMAIKIVNGKPRRLWCMTEADGQSNLRPTDHQGTYWKVAIDQLKKGRQQGMFPNFIGPLDGYSAFTQTLETFRLNKVGQSTCSHGAADTSGLGVPVITNPCGT